MVEHSSFMGIRSPRHVLFSLSSSPCFLFFSFRRSPLGQYRDRYYGTVSPLSTKPNAAHMRGNLNEATYAEYLNPLTLITINSHRATVHGRRCIFFLLPPSRSRIEFGQSVSKVHVSWLTNRCSYLAKFQMAILYKYHTRYFR